MRSLLVMLDFGLHGRLTAVLSLLSLHRGGRWGKQQDVNILNLYYELLGINKSRNGCPGGEGCCHYATCLVQGTYQNCLCVLPNPFVYHPVKANEFERRLRSLIPKRSVHVDRIVYIQRVDEKAIFFVGDNLYFTKDWSDTKGFDDRGREVERLIMNERNNVFSFLEKDCKWTPVNYVSKRGTRQSRTFAPPASNQAATKEKPTLPRDHADAMAKHLADHLSVCEPVLRFIIAGKGDQFMIKRVWLCWESNLKPESDNRRNISLSLAPEWGDFSNYASTSRNPDAPPAHVLKYIPRWAFLNDPSFWIEGQFAHNSHLCKNAGCWNFWCVNCECGGQNSGREGCLAFVFCQHFIKCSGMGSYARS
jgi:hypothetical protein